MKKYEIEAEKEILVEAITDYMFEVGKFKGFPYQKYSQILLDVRLWLNENKYLQNKIAGRSKGQESEGYWKQRCEAAEEMIENHPPMKLNYPTKYEKWQQLKQQTPQESEEAKDREIERLKGLIDVAFNIGQENYAGDKEARFNKFKAENNF